MSGKTNLLLSTDIGTDIDDAVALYLTMNSDVIDLKGVYVTNGPVVPRAKIAKHMLNLGGYEAPVMVGEAKALFTRLEQYTTGTERCVAPKRKKLKIVREWFSTMVRQLEELQDVVVASIAPLTNIAKLLEKRPDAAAKIKTLYIMGGREGDAEHNFSHDSLAADTVLNSDLDIVIVSGDVCSQYRLEADFLLNLDGSKAQRYLAHMASLWKLYYDNSRVLKRPLLELLNEKMKDDLLGKGEEERYRILETFDSLIMHMGMLCNAINFGDAPNEQLHIYGNVMGWAGRNQNLSYARFLLDYVKVMGLDKFSVSDAFVIYAIEHPEKVKEKRVTALCDDNGVMTLGEGERHRLVVDVDYKHFANYLKRRLEQKPRFSKEAKGGKAKVRV